MPRGSKKNEDKKNNQDPSEDKKVVKDDVGDLDSRPSPRDKNTGEGEEKDVIDNKNDEGKTMSPTKPSPPPSPFLRPGETPATTVARARSNPAAAAYSPNFVSNFFVNFFNHTMLLIITYITKLQTDINGNCF